MNDSHIPGLSMIVMNQHQILYQDSLGYAGYNYDSETDRVIGFSTQNDNIYMIGSITKTITCISVMQLVERGLINLDDDINKYLPLPIVNPYYSNETITMRHLLTHTSSIGTTHPGLSVLPNDQYSTINFTNFIYGALLEGGPFYSEFSWLKVHVGKEYHYSNLGTSLAGLIVEIVSNMDFKAFTTKYLFEPLNMSSDTFWLIDSLNTRQKQLLTNHHLFNASIDDFRFFFPFLKFSEFFIDSEPLSNISWINVTERFGLLMHPAGQLRTSVTSLAKHLLMFINNGTYNGIQILKSETVNEIKKIQFHTSTSLKVGLIYTYFDFKITKMRTVLGHNGGFIGVNSWMLMNPDTNIGVIVLSNGDVVNFNQYQSNKVTTALITITNYLFDVFETTA
ncbi:unnamed protein product [Didymodactylos carnosus]|uniref:Beta-lactamase-related domain-containing protein n=1 Tax=Didymodactylos carnosus TaxID=1234261 RepID=A0A815SW39_9BILA|nr:unnamed protein product [Didymodactylos carnosus]CAF4356064.1 unnamed protein product [Didymodactylos carnosus]